MFLFCFFFTGWNKICLNQLNLAERALSFLPCYALDLKDLTALRSQVEGSFFVTLDRSCSPVRPAQLRGWRQFSFFPQVVRCLLWECGSVGIVRQWSRPVRLMACFYSRFCFLSGTTLIPCSHPWCWRCRNVARYPDCSGLRHYLHLHSGPGSHFTEIPMFFFSKAVKKI